ncbi:MAG: HRDC domain-containing protein [Bacteroidaceae bacterium]
MQIKIFSIPILADEAQVEELNHFLRANKIIDIKKELAVVDGNSCWTFCITYMLTGRPVVAETGKSGTSKVDYKEVLAPNAFDRFSSLRKLRKQIADDEAVPAYAVFTDAELADMAQLPELTLHTMQGIPGIGKKKLEKYGAAFAAHFQLGKDEKGGELDAEDSKP